MEMYEHGLFRSSRKNLPKVFQRADRQSTSRRSRASSDRLVDEFGVQPQEAERSVTNELNKEFNIPVAGFGGSGGKAGSGTEEKKIADAVPGDWVTIEGKVVALSAPASPSIAQSGIIADESGAIRFVAWAKSNAPANGRRVVVPHRISGRGRVQGDPQPEDPLRHDGEGYQRGPLAHTHAGRRSGDLHPGIAGVRAKVIQEWDATHERMLQSGLLGDETGTIKFVIWKEPGKEKLVVGAVYTIFYAQVDEFNGRLSLNLNTATIMQEEGDIPVSGGEAAVRGSIVHIAPGSGIIKRCPVEGCNRALSRQNYCPIHEIQPKFVYDLRIKGWLDDGEKTHNILLQRDVVESLTGITLAAAQEIAENNPLGMDEVFLQMRDKVLGRYIVCNGREIDGRLLVNTCERVTVRDRANMLPC